MRLLPGVPVIKNSQTTNPFLSILLLLFFGSGCAALIYEVVWFELLELIIGSSAVSIGVLLGTFMGGMCLGSIALPRLIPSDRHPLRVYGLLELGIGVLGVLIFFGLPYAGGLYIVIGGVGTPGLLLRGLLSAVCLLPPTLLMGATLPAIARWVEATPKGVSWLGFFYGGNIAGAVFGALFAGFYLLRVHDLAFATGTASAINLVTAMCALWLSVQAPHAALREGGHAASSPVCERSWAVYLTIALSGMSALSAEVVWTRLLSLDLGATVYTFSLILAAFLLGLGIGSGAGSYLARAGLNVRAGLGWCQLLLIAGTAWAWHAVTRVLPFWTATTIVTAAPTHKFLVDFIKCSASVLPAAVLWGASFPLALAGVTPGRQDAGRVAGSVYAANTAGAILGALGTSLCVIGWLGTQGAQRIVIALAAAGAALMLSPLGSGESRVLRSGKAKVVSALAAVLLGGSLLWTVHPVPALLVGYGRNAAKFADLHAEFLYVGEGMNSSLAVSRLPNGVLLYHNAGKVQASSEPRDMGLQCMLGHMTTLVAKHPRSVLVIGCGAGVTAGAVSIDPAVERVTVAEIEPLVPRVVSAYFSEHNFNVLQNPKVRVEIDDARHFVNTTREKFDAITSDPLDPWVKGAATLYTREFFELLKRHLNPGGVVTVFVQLYQSSEDAVKSEFATFFEAFPGGSVWVNTTEEGEGYDVVLLGQAEETRIDLDEIARRLSLAEYAPVALSLGNIYCFSAEDLFATFGGMGRDLKPWFEGAQINRDRNLRLQYLAGLGLDLYRQDAIYREFLKYRRFPDYLFAGSPERLHSLRTGIEAYR